MDSAPSLDGLGRAVLAGLTQGERASVERHRLTEHEHNDVIWPELPASAPEVNFPLDYAWQNIQSRHRRSLARTRATLEGRNAAFRSVDCRGETQSFETFEVHTDCWVVFDLTDRGERFEVQLFKDVVARGGGYKYFRLYDEEPRRMVQASARGDERARGRLDDVGGGGG